MISYSSIGEFYRSEGIRAVSAELAYGGRWKLQGWPGNFRVAYIEDTGEVYAEHCRDDGEPGAVLVLGVIPLDAGDEGEYYHSADRVIRDCLEVRPRARGLSLLVARIREHQGANVVG